MNFCVPSCLTRKSKPEGLARIQAGGERSVTPATRHNTPKAQNGRQNVEHDAFLQYLIPHPMELFDVQVTTDLGEVVVLQVTASDKLEAEMTAISMVSSGEAGTLGRGVTDCFAL